MSIEMFLAKLHFYGFDEISINWMDSYLGKRQQVTRLGGETSKPLVRVRGVPQGSRVGPKCFVIYTADRPRHPLNSTDHDFADDKQLHLSFEPELIMMAIDAMNSDLDNLYKWSVNNGLKLNVDKCKVLYVAPKEVVQALSDGGMQVSLNGQSLAITDKVKTLGVVLDSDLNFSDHVTYTMQKALGRLRGMYRFKDLLPESAKVKLIQSCVLSLFYYCYPAYGNSISREDMERVQKLQNTAVRFVYGLKRFDHVSPYRQDAKLPLMEDVCRVLTCCMVHKTLALGEPEYLARRLRRRDEVALRGTRHGEMLHFPRVRLEVGRKSFSYFGPSLYNDLPVIVKNSISFDAFKKKIKSVLYDC